MSDQDGSGARELLSRLMCQDPFLSYTQGMPTSTPPGTPSGRTQQNTGRQAGDRDSSRPLPQPVASSSRQMILSSTSSTKRKPPTEDEDEDNDHDMQGKDVPTIFKRLRQDLPGNGDPALASRLLDAPFMSIALQLPASGLYPELGLPGSMSLSDARSTFAGVVDTLATQRPRIAGNEPAAEIEPNPTASSSRQITYQPSSPPSPRRHRRSQDTSQQDVDDGVLGGDESSDTDECGQEPRRGRSRAEKGKERAAGEHDGEGAGPRWSTFATQSEVSYVRQDLQQLNNNMSRLVTLVDQQTKLFSTILSRSDPPHASADGGNPPPPPPPPAEHQSMDVDDEFVPRTNLRPKRRGRRAPSAPKKHGLPVQRDDDDNALYEKIRKVTRQLMGRASAKDKLTVDMLPTIEAVEAYKLSQGPCCTTESFKPDLSATPGTPWNKSIVQIFVEHFTSTSQYPDAPADRVHESFEGHLKYLCSKYKLTKRGKEMQKIRQQLANRAERQRNLFHRRLAVAKMFPALRHHVPILELLGPFGMSSDESSHVKGRPGYRVFKKTWRNPALTTWLRLFDSIYRRLRFNEIDKNTPGSHPHLRMYCEEVSNRRTAVKRLPSNAYNPAWLEGLNQYDRALLEVNPTTYDFSHPADITRLAQAYNGAINPLGLYF